MFINILFLDLYMRRGDFVKVGLSGIISLFSYGCTIEETLQRIASDTLNDELIQVDTSIPYGDSIFATKVLGSDGGVVDSLENVLDEPDGIYASLKKPFFGNSYIVVGFERPFSSLHAFVRVSEPTTITAYAGEIVYAAKIDQNYYEKSVHKIIAGAFLPDYDRSDGGIIDISSPINTCPTIAFFYTGYTPERILILESDGDIEIDCFVLYPSSFVYNTDFFCGP